MTEEAKFLLRKVEISLAMGQIKSLSKSDLPVNEKLDRIQKITDDLSKAIERVGESK